MIRMANASLWDILAGLYERASGEFLLGGILRIRLLFNGSGLFLGKPD